MFHVLGAFEYPALFFLTPLLYHLPQSVLAAIIMMAVAGYLGAALLIFLAAPYLAQAAAQIAAETGLGDTFVGTTLVALATSLPELVATIAAMRMGSLDLAIGNIFGSNAFNMLLLVPLGGFDF